MHAYILADVHADILADTFRARMQPTQHAFLPFVEICRRRVHEEGVGYAGSVCDVRLVYHGCQFTPRPNLLDFGYVRGSRREGGGSEL